MFDIMRFLVFIGKFEFKIFQFSTHLKFTELAHTVSMTWTTNILYHDHAPFKSWEGSDEEKYLEPEDKIEVILTLT